MKKLSLICIALMTVFVMTGCGNKGKKAAKAVEAEQVEMAAEDKCAGCPDAEDCPEEAVAEDGDLAEDA